MSAGQCVVVLLGLAILGVPLPLLALIAVVVVALSVGAPGRDP